MASFSDPWNPTWPEISDWAFDLEAGHPCQDWELALLWRGFEDLYLELAADESCPKSGFFLSLLYLIVGDQVRRLPDSQIAFNLKDFIAKADRFNCRALEVWQQRSRDLLRHPEKFDYDQWCAGGLAYEGSFSV